MNKDIADIIVDKIAGLAWVEKYAGLTRPITISQPNPNGATTPVKKTFPVACNVTPEECDKKGLYNDLMPNSKYKSVMYFEDFGINITGSDAHYINCQSTLRLVCWLNGKKLGYDGCGISSIAVMGILKVFAGMFNPFNEGNFVKIKIGAVSEAPKEPQIFTKYSYDESASQLLMYPFDYFALNLRVDFSIPFNCITDFEVLPEQC